MKLTNLKKPKKSKKELNAECEPCEVSENKYPYGLRLHFDSELVDKVPGLKTLKAGQKVMLEAKAMVSEVGINEDQNKKRHRVELQLTDIGIHTKAKDDVANKDKIFDEASK